jgi:5-formyltetrahydrofolate cyclo-ligase
VTNSAIAAAKAAMRVRLLAARSAASPVARDQHGNALATLVDLLPGDTVACYLAVGSEPPTSALIAALHARGSRVLVPVLRSDSDLDWTPYLPGVALRPGLRGTVIPATAPQEPSVGVALADADLILVPALAVDPAGHRLGRGGGSYDRALTRRRSGVTVLGVVYDGEWLDYVPADVHDVTVAGALTPSGPRRVL